MAGKNPQAKRTLSAVYSTEEEKRIWLDIAAEEGRSLSGFISWCIQNYIKKRKPKTATKADTAI